MLVGRHTELALLTQALDGARHGRSETRLVRGPAGVGKTALVRAAADEAESVAWLTGSPHRQTPYGGIRDLLQYATKEGAHPWEALSRATGGRSVTSGAAPTVFQVAADVLDLLSWLAPDTGALALVVDDAHWLDSLSWSALRLALGRMPSDRVLTLVVARDEAGVHEPWAGDLEGVATLQLHPLPEHEAQTLLTAVAGLDDERAADLVARVGGNPLRLLQAAATGQLRPGGDPTDASPFLPRLADVDPSVRLCLLAVILEPGASTAMVRAALATVRRQGGRTGADLEPEDALASALAARWLVPERGRLSVAHPSIADAVLALASGSERRAMHAALAESPGIDQAWGRPWHAAEAVDGHDPERPVLLSDLARTAEACGDLAVTSRLLEQAAELADAPAERLALLLRAGLAAVQAGLPTGSRLLRQVMADARAPAQREQAVVRLALLAAWNGDLPGLRDVAEGSDEATPTTAIMLATLLSTTSLVWGDREIAERQAVVMDEFLESAPAQAPPLTLIQHAGSALTLGHGIHLPPLLAGADAVLALADHDLALPAMMSLFWHDEWARAETVLSQLLPAARSASALPAVAWIQTGAAEIHLHHGRLAEARIAATEAGQLAQGLAMPLAQTMADAALALVEAVAGRDEPCRAALDRSLPRAVRLHLGAPLAYLGRAEARLHLGMGRLEDAETVLEAVLEGLGDMGFCAHHVITTLPELIEVKVRLRRRDQASALMTRLELDTMNLPLPSVRAWTAHARLCLGSAGDLDERYRAAEELSSLAGDTHLRARIHLVYGELLRRSRRPRDSVAPLVRAHEAFTAVGADSWARRAEVELRATGSGGELPVPGPESLLAGLTVQEQQIARVAATGLSTREIASSLFLSPKTVERHLTQVYRKLGVTSKARLAHLLSDGRALAVADNEGNP